MAKNSDSNLLKSFGKDTLLYVPYRLFPVIFGFIGLWAYTRVFTPADYGTYTLLNITIGLLGILAYSWINNANIRFYPPYKNENRLKTYFTNSFTLQAITLAVILLALAVTWYLKLLPAIMLDYTILLALTMVVVSFFETCLTILRSERKATEASFFRSVSALLILIVSLALIYICHMGIASILLGYIITNLGLTVVIVLKYHFIEYLDARSFSISSLKEFTAYGLPLIGNEVFYWILVLSDRYIIEFFRGSQEVGIYSAAYQLADYPISMFTSMMLIAALPIIIETWEKRGEGSTKTLITGLMRYYLLFVIPAFIGVTILAQNIMVILTDEYYSGWVIVPFICLSKALFGVAWYLNKGLELKKKTSLLAVMIALAGIMDIGLNLLLVPSMGFLGAGLSLGISYVAYSLLSLVVGKAYLNWTIPWRSIRNITAAAIPMGITVFLVQQFLPRDVISLVLLVATGSLVYLAVILLTGEIREESKFFTKAAIKSIKNVFKSVYGNISYSLAALIK